ncbi:MAG: HAD family hydrolase [Planctomycetota bacterium]|jgi:putative hydrolase of the HAD superfamily
MALKAVIFDIEGTLLRREGAGPLEKDMEGLRRAHEVLTEGGVPLPDFRTTYAMVYRELSRSRAGLVYGNFREMSIPDLVRGFLEKAFPDAGDALVEGALEAWYEPVARSARLVPGASEALEAVRSLGLRAAGAGNTPWGSPYLRKDLERLGIADRFEALVGSADVGYRKPNLFLLAETLRRLGADGEETVHVGDDPAEDVEAPQELGMRAVVIGPPGSVDRADATIPTLEGLAGVLEGWMRKP